MTTKQIAEAVGKKPRTVHGWVERVSAKNAQVYAKIAQAKSTSVAADYTQDETLAIIREGMGEVPAGVYKASADSKPSTPHKLPNGTQLRELRMIYGAKEAARRLDLIIGYQSDSVEVMTIPVTKDIGKISKRAYAVEMQERERQRRLQIEQREPGLFD